MGIPQRLAAFDGNWLVHRSYHASAANNPDPESVQRVVASQVTSQIFSYALTLQATHILVAFDGGECFRKDVWPLYKVGRLDVLDRSGNKMDRDELVKAIKKGMKLIEAPDPVNECRKATQAMVAHHLLPFIHDRLYEADDWLTSACAISSPTLSVASVTKDKDGLGGLTPYSFQWYPQSGKDQPPVKIKYTDLSKRLVKYVGACAKDWTPKQFLEYQILIGDPTDDVPEIISPGKARAILTNHASLLDFFKTKEGAQFYATQQEYLKRNRALVMMRRDLLKDKDLKELLVPQKSVEPRGSKSLQKARQDYLGWLKAALRPSLF